MRVSVQIIRTYSLDVPPEERANWDEWVYSLATGTIATLGDLEDVEVDYAEVIEGSEDRCQDCNIDEDVESSYCGSFCPSCREYHNLTCEVCRNDAAKL